MRRITIAAPAPAPYSAIIVDLETGKTTGIWEDNFFRPGKPSSEGRFDRWDSTPLEIARAEGIEWAYKMIGYIPGKSRVITD